MGDVHTVGRPLNTWHGYCCKIVISLIDPVSGPRPATSQLRRDSPPQRSTSSSIISSSSMKSASQQHQLSSGSSISASPARAKRARISVYYLIKRSKLPQFPLPDVLHR